MSSTRAISFSRCSRVASCALVATLFARAATAQQAPPASNDAANADSLFTEAKQLMANGDYATACPKLAESYRLDPGTGTLTALAVCHQHIGKVATAWNEFVEVASSAQRQGRADREAFARQQITAIEPLLSRLTIQVPPEVAAIPKLEVRRDATVVSQPAWGVPVPVDPGDHLIEATAPDREPWTAHITVDANADKKEIAVPVLDKQVAATPPVEQTPTPSPVTPAETPTDHHAPFPMRTVGLVVGGAGIVSLALGGYFGASAISKSSDAKKECPASSPCGNAGAVSENNDAKSDALISDITVIAGVAAIGTGVFMFLTAPKEAAPPSEAAPTSAWRLVPTIGRHGAGLTLHAAF
jgi:hypothetical protein